MLRAQDYFPVYVRKSALFNALCDALNNSDNEIEANIKELEKQLSVMTATWGLDVYEKELGIQQVAGKPLQERRQYIMSKWRGSGNVNTAMIKSIVNSYVPDCEIEVLFDSSKITIRFIDTKGVPANIADCEHSIREIMPCHLGLEFIYLYNTWEDIEKRGQEWDKYEAQGNTWEQLSTL